MLKWSAAPLSKARAPRNVVPAVRWSIQTSSMAPAVEMTAAAGIDQICTRPGLRTSPPI